MKSLLTVTKKHLIELKGLSDAKVDKMLEAAHKLLPASGFVTAAEFPPKTWLGADLTPAELVERCARLLHCK